MNYFDYAASAPIYPEVLKVLAQSSLEDFANPGAQHSLGNNLFLRMEEIREVFLRTLEAKPNDNFIFTSSATESNNTVIKGLGLKSTDAVLFSRADHASVTASVDSLDVAKKEIPHNSDGTIHLERFAELLDSNVKLVVISHVNNQSGVVNDVHQLAELVKEKTSAHFHVDAVQSFGKITCKVSDSIHSLSVTSHKLGGPKGVAGLYLRNGHSVKPLLTGGAQESGLRSGTVAFPLIHGFYEAMKISTSEREQLRKAGHFCEMIRAGLKNSIPEILFPFNQTSPYIISFLLPGISSDIILRHLEVREVYISSTSACSSRVSGFNSSLAAVNVAEKYHKNFLRISTGPQTTEEEVKKMITEFACVWNEVKHLRSRV